MVELTDIQIQGKFIEGHVSAKPETNSVHPFEKVDRLEEINAQKITSLSDGKQEIDVHFEIDNQDPLE